MNSRFRNGIFLLSIVLFVGVTTYYLLSSKTKVEDNFVELKEFQKQVDSLKQIAQLKNKKFQAQLFNPNFISDYKGYMLGLTSGQLDRLNRYRKSGKWINSVTEFKDVTQVSDSLLNEISSLFKFPDWVKQESRNQKFKNKKYPTKSYAQKKDLNVVTFTELQNDVKLPDFMAKRIVNYRNKIGGFVDDIQIKDIRGLYDNQQKKLLSMFTVKTPKQIKKININSATVKELIEVPYFDFEMALEIVDRIKDTGKISNFSELKKINGFSLEKIDRIALYLTLN